MRQDMNDDETRTPAYCEDIYILPELAPRCLTDGVTFAGNPRTFFQRSVYFFLYMTYKSGCGWVGNETKRNGIQKTRVHAITFHARKKASTATV